MLILENTESAEYVLENWLTREKSQALRKPAGKIIKKVMKEVS